MNKKYINEIILNKNKVFMEYYSFSYNINIFKLLKIEENELKNSRMLCNLLSLNIKEHSFSFANDFFKFITGNDINNKLEVKREYITKNSKFIDLLIWDKKENAIIIENKINSGDNGKNQIEDYYNDIKSKLNKDCNIYIVYLTRNSKNPSENSLSYTKKKELEEKNRIKFKSHNDIADWLKNILENKEFFNENKYIVLKSAIIQFIENERFLSKRKDFNTSLDGVIMKNETINQILNNIDSIKEIDEYIDYFNCIADKFNNKKIDIINKTVEPKYYFTSKIYSIIKEKEDSFDFAEKDDVISSINKQGWYHTIYKNYGKNVWNIIELSCNNIIFGILDNGINHQTKNKIREKEKYLKNKILDSEVIEWENYIYSWAINLDKLNDKKYINEIANNIIKLDEIIKSILNEENS